MQEASKGTHLEDSDNPPARFLPLHPHQTLRRKIPRPLALRAPPFDRPPPPRTLPRVERAPARAGKRGVGGQTREKCRDWRDPQLLSHVRWAVKIEGCFR